MNAIARLIGSVIVAAAFGVPLIFLVTSTGTGGLNFFEAVLAFFLGAFMFASFGVIWNWGSSNDHDQAEQQARQKRKEGDRINRLLQKLDEEDIERLRERLMEHDQTDYMLGNDGEILQRRQ